MRRESSNDGRGPSVVTQAWHSGTVKGVIIVGGGRNEVIVKHTDAEVGNLTAINMNYRVSS